MQLYHPYASGMRPSAQRRNGSRQSSSLPHSGSGPPVPYETEEEENGKTRTKTKYKVLVVEDDEDILRRYIYMGVNWQKAITIPRKLQQQGRHWKSIFNKTPDLVISDVMMPEMDGLTLCRKIKKMLNLNHIR